jgi:hypothetical protein
MKTTINSIVWVTMALTTIVFVLDYDCVLAQKNNEFKMGIYDSRAVTYAYIKSDLYKKEQEKVRKERDDVMQKNDTVLWEQTMFQVMTEQFLLHQRFFATGSATSILKKVEDKLPKIAKNAGVSTIVSKWELIWQDPDIVTVDLTDSIAQLFTPFDKLDKTYIQTKESERIDVDEWSVEEVVEMWKTFEKKYLKK